MHIPHSRPCFDASYQEAVNQVVATCHTASGEEAQALERDLAECLQAEAVVAVDSGTSALMLAIKALQQSKDVQRVGIPSYACASLLFAVRAAGCQPVFMDCNAHLRLDVDKAADMAASLDAVVLVHPFGMVEPLVSEAWPCPVIEDIAQAAGAAWEGRALGGFGQMAIGSHYATKPWGGAYGGFVAGNSMSQLEAVRSMCDPDQGDFSQAYVGHHQLSDVHAALARRRLQCAPEEMTQRHAWIRKMCSWLDKHPLMAPVQGLDTGNGFRLIVRCITDAEAVIGKFRAQGVSAARPVQQPLHRAGEQWCEGAEAAWQQCVSLPVLVDMNDQEAEWMERVIRSCVV